MIAYSHFSDFPGWERAATFLRALIDEHTCTSVLEVGAGANPTLDATFLERRGILYTINDVSADELNKADPTYDRLVLDLSRPDAVPLALREKYDCVFSRMVGEHISDGSAYHANLYKVLKPGGISAHCVAALGCLPFVANYCLPKFITDRLLSVVLPRDRDVHDKFPAYYSWSRGPTRQMIRRFQRLGFEIINYTGYFGHPYYSRRLPVLHKIELLKTAALVRRPIPQCCSYAAFILRKR